LLTSSAGGNFDTTMFKSAQAITLGGLDSTATKAGYQSRALQDIIGSGTGVILSLIGTLFLIMMIAGGIIWMTAGGNDTRVATARKL